MDVLYCHINAVLTLDTVVDVDISLGPKLLSDVLFTYVMRMLLGRNITEFCAYAVHTNHTSVSPPLNIDKTLSLFFFDQER